jgi:hypothetical protein
MHEGPAACALPRPVVLALGVRITYADEATKMEKLAPSSPPLPAQPKRKTVLARCLSGVREGLAISVWGYTLIKAWVFDVDIYVLSRVAPTLVWLIQYKLFIALGLVAAALLITRNATAVGWAAYIAFYPFIAVGKLVYLIFKQRSWLLVLAFVNSAMSLFRSFKYNFITATAFLLALVLALASHTKTILVLAIIAFASVLVVTYLRAFLTVFRPSNVFRVYKKLTEKLPELVKKTLEEKAEEAGLVVSNMTDVQLQAYRTKLQSLLLWDKALLLLSKKLELYLKSGVTTLALLFNLLLLTVICLISFATMSLALQKFAPGAFAVSGNSSFFLFFYHSLRTFTFGSIPEITPVATLSRMLVMAELIFAVLTLTLLVTLLFSVKKEKQNQELLETIHDLKSLGMEVEGAIVQRYKISDEEAFAEIGKMANNMAKVITWLTQNAR